MLPRSSRNLSRRSDFGSENPKLGKGALKLLNKGKGKSGETYNNPRNPKNTLRSGVNFTIAPLTTKMSVR